MQLESVARIRSLPEHCYLFDLHGKTDHANSYLELQLHSNQKMRT